MVVPRVLPRMRPEPPPAYVGFVDRHLSELRLDTVRAVGDARGADEVYPEVLTDVAARWGWFELLRTRLSQPQAADTYLRRAFARRVKRWADQQVYPVEVEVRSADGGWSYRPGPRPPAPAPASWALRKAPLVAPAQLQIGAVIEASVAWWHAYENRRRRRRIAAVTAVIVAFVAIANLQRGTAEAADLNRPAPALNRPAPATVLADKAVPEGVNHA